jgi:PAS domain-containing protein
MKLTNKNENLENLLYVEHSGDIEREFKNISVELRKIEDKFYKIFDMNPCPMAINEIEHNRIIDVNQAFIDAVGIKNKCELIGKSTIDLQIIKEKDKTNVLNQLNKHGMFKDYITTFKTLKGKKIQGIFSGSVIELNGIKCLFTVCQIVNKKCLFKTYFIF